jgi:hypothetical protein
MHVKITVRTAINREGRFVATAEIENANPEFLRGVRASNPPDGEKFENVAIAMAVQALGAELYGAAFEGKPGVQRVTP